MAEQKPISSTGYGPRSRIYFDGNQSSYQIWETRFINYLYTIDKGLHKAILPKLTDVDDDTDLNTKNRWAYAELVQVLDERSLQLIMNDSQDNGREALKVLRKHYASIEKPRVLTLYEELTTLRMSPTEDITDFMIRAERAATGLRSAGENISDNLIIAMILKGLPDAYKPFVVIHTQLDQAKSLTEFKAAVHNYANTESVRTSTQQSTALATTTNQSKRQQGNASGGTQLKCMACGKANHKSSQCRSKAKLKCGYCQAQGHIEKECMKKQREKSSTQSANATKSTEFTFTISADVDHANNTTSNNSRKLLVDCGATCHIVNNVDYFTSFDPNFNPKKHFIQLADGHRSNELATAKGKAQFNLPDSDGKVHKITLNNALLAPDFPVSLFSVQTAVQSGAEITFAKDYTKLTANGTDFNITKLGKLYYLQTDVLSDDSANVTKSIDECHTILGHTNYDDIVSLQGVTRGMKVQGKATKTCTTCTTSKMTKLPKSYDDPPTYATQPLQRVHSDLCGPIEPVSREGHKYIINFVDEYSSMLFVYFLRAKSEADKALQQFIADVAPIGSVKELHSDNGGEYMSQSFQKTLLDNQIKHSTTTPHTPYQNGKSERSWRSILEMSRCLISDAQLAKTFWPYAVKHSQYVRNRSYQRRTKSTAYELFTNEKPDMSKIHRFGSPCTYYIDGHKQKLDARGQPGIYLGINTQNKGYYVLNDRKVVTTRNVTMHVNTDNSPQCYEEKIERKPYSVNHDISSQNTDSGSLSREPEAVIQPTPRQTNGDEQTTPNQPPIQTRPRRERKTPAHLSDYYLSLAESSTDYAYNTCTIPLIPNTYEEAIASDDSSQWKAAMDIEMSTLQANNTWTTKPLPAGREETKGRWVFTVKQGKKPGQIQYKARYVARGYSQIHGVDYDETYSPTTKFTSIRTLLQKAVNENLHLHQLDVKGAYLNAPIDKDIYVQQPPGYEKYNTEGTKLTCHLNKSLYGLKQSGRNWHTTFTEYLKSMGYTASDVDPCIYTKHVNSDQVVILFWVDDIIVGSSNQELINQTKQTLHDKFKMDDRGKLQWFLGIDFQRLSNGHYQMSQERYTEAILKRFNMADCKPANTPADKGIYLTKATDDDKLDNSFPYRQAIGSLIYLMTGTRPDLSWIISKLSQFLEKPTTTHVTAVKRVLRYIKSTKSYSLTFTPSDGTLLGYSDSDWGGDLDERRSTTGYIFTIGKSAPISWKSHKQPVVALSSSEAEYMAMVEATKEAIHLRQLLTSFDMAQDKSTNVYVDNQSAIALAQNTSKHHNRSKHIDIRYHFLRLQTDVVYTYVETKKNLADILTKPLDRIAHTQQSNMLFQLEGAC
jgi:transposase InsO family protein